MVVRLRVFQLYGIAKVAHTQYRLFLILILPWLEMRDVVLSGGPGQPEVSKQSGSSAVSCDTKMTALTADAPKCYFLLY